MNVPVPLDHFPINALTSKVFSFMVKKGKYFSGKVTPLFASMLVQPTEDEGATSERPSEPQPTPHPPHPSEANDSGGNHGGQSSSDRSLSENEGDMTLQSVYDLCISLCTQIGGKEVLEETVNVKGVCIQTMEETCKAEPSVNKDLLFDELADDTLDYIDTEIAQDIGRTRFVVHEKKEREEKEVSTNDALGTNKEKVSTGKEKDSTDKEKDSTNKEKDSTDRPDEGIKGISATPTTPTPTPATFRDDETIAQVLLNMSQAKAVSREKE
ncbi:hypothetical protein Tco_1488513, partial [Tanacetum coccineum]